MQRVDVNPITHNILFRGSAPIQHDQFDYAGLINQMKTVYPPLPTRFKLVVINLIGGKNHSVFTKEQTFFKHHQNAGEILSWPVYGTTTQPVNPLWFYFNKHANNTTQLTIDHNDPFSAYYGIHLAQTLKTMMNTQYDVPHIFYVHCSIGCDRTGELTTIYTIAKHQNTNNIDALLVNYLKDHNIKACYGQYPSQNALNAIKWACFYFANANQNTASPWVKYVHYYAQCRYLTAYSHIRTLKVSP